MNNLTSIRKAITIIIFFGLIILFYVVGVFLTFKPRSSGSEYAELIAFILTFIGGLTTFVLGFSSVVILGGKSSLGLVEFIAGLNGSKQIIEIQKQPQTKAENHIRVSDTSRLYIPALVFAITLALAINIHYLNITVDITTLSVLSNALQIILNPLDIFTKPTTVGSLRYSIEIIPVMIFFVTLSGVIPSIVFPYLRKFKITSVNGAPFHRDILFGTIGALFGITIVLSLVDIIYGILVGSQPHYYSYLLPTLIGFSLHYSLGAYVARERAEEIVEKLLNTRTCKRIFQGKVTIQKL